MRESEHARLAIGFFGDVFDERPDNSFWRAQRPARVINRTVMLKRLFGLRKDESFCERPLLSVPSTQVDPEEFARPRTQSFWNQRRDVAAFWPRRSEPISRAAPRRENTFHVPESELRRYRSSLDTAIFARRLIETQHRMGTYILSDDGRFEPTPENPYSPTD